MKFLFKQELENKNRFLFILLSLFVFYLPLIMSNTLYFDDNTRVLTGKAYWDVDGRPLTDIVFYFLNSNFGTVSNIQPLPLIVGIIMLSFGLYYATGKMVYQKTVFHILPFLLLVCNPFFLQNMSYQFDSIGMSCAFFFILMAFFYEPKINNKITYLYPVLFLCLSNCFYQPVSNVFLTLFFANILVHFKEYKNILNETLYRALIYISGMALYFVLAFFVFPVTPERSHFIKPEQLIDSTLTSVKKFNEFLSGFINDYFIFIGVISLIFIGINYLFSFYINIKKENTNVSKISSSAITLITPVGLVFSLWGPFLFIDELFFNPREFPSVGVFLFLALFSFKRIDKREYIYSLLTTFMMLYVLSFSYIYGNTIKNQRDYENTIYSDIVNNINNNKELSVSNRIEIYGETGISPKALNAYNNHPFLIVLAQPSYRWVQRYIIKSYGLNNVSTNVAFDDEKEWSDICSQKQEPVIWNRNYEIYQFKNHISVWLKKDKSDTICKIKPEKYYNQFSKNLK